MLRLTFSTLAAAPVSPSGDYPTTKYSRIGKTRLNRMGAWDQNVIVIARQIAVANRGRKAGRKLEMQE